MAYFWLAAGSGTVSAFGTGIVGLTTMQDVSSELPDEKIPTGTAYFVGYLGNHQHTLNTVRIHRGKATVIRNEGAPILIMTSVTATSGDRVAYLADEMKRVGNAIQPVGYRVVSIPEGKSVPLGVAADGIFGFSASKKYASLLRPTDGTKKLAPGILVVDTDRQLVCWETEGIGFPAWSSQGDSLVFARFLEGGKYAPLVLRSNPLPDAFYRRTPVENLENTHFFVVKMGERGAGSERRISLTEAKQFVGNWYPSLMRVAYEKRSFLATAGSVVAPGNRGCLFVDFQDKYADASRPRFPDSTSQLNWLTLFLDATGRVRRYKDSPALDPISWSRDGERVFCRPGDRFQRGDSRSALICFWVRSGRYVEVTLPEGVGNVLSYIEE